jgi:3'-phosphoadenosine 5'-phosphosulfate sulfotransferase (PAPS reductase)/FAD synthetase
MQVPITFVPRQKPNGPVVDLFGLGLGSKRLDIETAPQVNAVLAAAAPVFISVSGGRDSQALAYRVSTHLDDIGHRGARYLIHADLGRVEWGDSMPVCERLARRLGVELIVVRRKAGDMMDRWLSRVRQAHPALEQMRRRHPSGDVVSAVGIRREESSNRARMPVWKEDARTTRARGFGHTWNAILSWRREEVNEYIRSQGDVLHEAYTAYGSTRVSCAFCVLGSEHDLRASASCAANQAIYRTMVELEAASTYSFKSNRWLADVAPDLLDASLRMRVREAKERAQLRIAAEARIPEHLLYVKGWPTVVPALQEAELVAGVRRDVAAAVHLTIQHTDRDSVLCRYRELMQLGRLKAGGAARARGVTHEELP